MKKDKRLYPFHFLHGLSEYYTIHGIMIAVDIGDEPAANINVLLMSEHFVYFAQTNEHGIAVFPTIADETYTVYLVESGFNQDEFPGHNFNEDTFLDVVYKHEEKTVYNGMFANTPPQMYVDGLDGGGA